jgi:3D (Asp-Asp-Asp) domain-containing protein
MPIERLSQDARCRGRSAVRLLFMILTSFAAVHFTSWDCAEVAGEHSARRDSRSLDIVAPVLPAPIPAQSFQATAYSGAGLTRSGIPAAPGLVAADPAVLPLGSIVHVETPRYRGIYEVADTGRLIKGRIIDIFLPTIEAALEFGRQEVKVIVLRYGGSEKDSNEETSPAAHR